ncbi:hypothetical protein CGZ53_01640 [Streptococcus uberis]|nr:hypothetical protein CGZ53_01640 [Streptococcus uberis]
MNDRLKMYLFFVVFSLFLFVGCFVLESGSLFSNCFTLIGLFSFFVSAFYFIKLKLHGLFNWLSSLVEKIRGI